MLNISIIILLLLILISKNIILLNEETLILLCFTTFCWLGFNQLKDSFSKDFIEQTNKIENDFKDSFNLILTSLNSNLQWQNIFKKLSTNFNSLEVYLKNFNLIITDRLPLIHSQNVQQIYLKKLLFTQRLEQQTGKIIILLLMKKIEKITTLKYFYSTKIKFPNFECNYKIILREYIEII
uniref:ATP synthase F0 subunit b n=1 Tax=Gracilariopsis longissima TaxID=172976 RepID=A0A345UBI7_9FLOR|nr:ATP synthase F0 subunit b [Gracilariopsis longissima]AXI97823.1 ATP synthase F0 subunit b [Gracilariopsis longissima]UAD89924.1 ATP synthase F0 subunit b [Gracilariopsis longissima]